MSKTKYKEVAVRLLMRGEVFSVSVLADDMGWSEKYLDNLRKIAIERLQNK